MDENDCGNCANKPHPNDLGYWCTMYYTSPCFVCTKFTPRVTETVTKTCDQSLCGGCSKG